MISRLAIITTSMRPSTINRMSVCDRLCRLAVDEMPELLAELDDVDALRNDQSEVQRCL
jgi:hypothetical protein